MTANILVAIPYKGSMHPLLIAGMHQLADNLTTANIQVVEYCNSVPHSDIPFAMHAAARNGLLDAYLQPEHDWVMWIDADLVDYPPNLIDLLLEVNPGGITAPMVLIEGSEQFYDTYGYVQHMHKIGHLPPYFDNPSRLVIMDAVGCAYLIPAWLYHQGLRYFPIPGETEHYSVMQAARQAGLQIVCRTDVTIYHADLPRYGEGYHGH